MFRAKSTFRGYVFLKYLLCHIYKPGTERLNLIGGNPTQQRSCTRWALHETLARGSPVFILSCLYECLLVPLFCLEYFRCAETSILKKNLGTMFVFISTAAVNIYVVIQWISIWIFININLDRQKCVQTYLCKCL